jgi:hypothetical protein
MSQQGAGLSAADVRERAGAAGDLIRSKAEPDSAHVAR